MKRSENFHLESYGINHIAFILDGNGRWAAKRSKPRSYGHAKGFDRLFDVALAVNKRGIKVMSVYAFSTENWNRPQQEIDFLFKTLEKKLTSVLKKANKHGIKIMTSGDLKRLPETTQNAIKTARESSVHNPNLILNICVNYGGRDEIIRSVKKLYSDLTQKKLTIDEVTPDVFDKYLDTSGLPPVDLLIRTSGEQRLSNFMMWQLAYAEFIFTPTFWPDYNEETLVRDLEEYGRRVRRFGGL